MPQALPPAPPALVAQAATAWGDGERLEAVSRFFEAFARRDGAAMGRLYAQACRFSDPVFPELRGPQVPAMWRMLTQRAPELRLHVEGWHALPGGVVEAFWVARYPFSATGRQVENRIRSRFRFEGALVVEQVDDFDLPAWMGQALGPLGQALGWSPWLQGLLRQRAQAGLEEFMRTELPRPAPTPSPPPDCG